MGKRNQFHLHAGVLEKYGTAVSRKRTGVNVEPGELSHKSHVVAS